MIYITGDTHCPIDIDKLRPENFPESEKLTKDDHVIICGDCGIIWDGGEHDEHWKKWFDSLNFTTLFIDGNHENHDLLSEMPIERMFGAKVHRISDSVFHLIRGMVYEIEGYSFFTMGGAMSTDISIRTPGESWWAGEVPDYIEQMRGFSSLEQHGCEVDYILTHTAPISVIGDDYEFKGQDPTSFYLEDILEHTKFKKWFFGHFHEDNDFGKFRCLYNDIVRLD